ncbi:MAG TPA: heterodisulfide reductase-related iron-sulfur binding cluster, partial [Polyangiaceae bacterium]|nr:heterodisulfide reductase-related iron-sulfur binding cluster [Polyangiaceae bacterium]
PPAVDPDDPRYWDAKDLEGELKRVFQVCHECRMCVGYCGTFPSVFNAVDRDIESGKSEGAEHLGGDDFTKASDLCWQCKLCYIKCPYTADEGASELLDFPRLMGREKAQRAKRDGVQLVDRVLGEPGVIGQLGSGAAAPIANLINASRLLRKVTEKVTGVSAEFPLPPLERDPFPSWIERHAPLGSAGEAGEVVIFSTCYGDYNQSNVPRAAVRVLEHQGYRVIRPHQVCCGMPNLDGGDIDAMRQKVKTNVESLLPHVRRGKKIVVPSPTCGYTMKKEWPLYVAEPEVREVAEATLDLMQFLDTLRRNKTMKTDWKKPLGNVAYHAACHLRAQKIAFPGMRILNAVPDSEVRLVEQCSAVDGTWGMKAEFYDLGLKYAQKLVRGIAEGENETVVTDCQLSARRIEKENQVRVIHPVEAVAEAYGLAVE